MLFSGIVMNVSFLKYETKHYEPRILMQFFLFDSFHKLCMKNQKLNIIKSVMESIYWSITVKSFQTLNYKLLEKMLVN